MTVIDEKRELRRLARARREAMTPQECAGAAEGLRTVLGEALSTGPLQCLLAYLPLGNEADCRLFLSDWLDAGRRLCLPRLRPETGNLEFWQVPSLDAVTPGYRGILEPVSAICRPAPLAEVEVVLVPGLLFDLSGGRLGQGGGHFDQFLAGLQDDIPRIGIAHEWQIIDGRESALPGAVLPRELHDVPMHRIATPRRMIDCRTPANTEQGSDG